MLENFHAVDLNVVESKSSLRRTSYGFRDKLTQERVYIRVEGSSICVYRDNPGGFVTGKRYLIPDLLYMKNFDFVRFKERIRKHHIRMGLRITNKDHRKFIENHKERYKLGAVLLWKRIEERKRRYKRKHKEESINHEKANRYLSAITGKSSNTNS